MTPIADVGRPSDVAQEWLQMRPNALVAGAATPILDTTGLLDRGANGEILAFLRPGDWLFGGGAGTVRTLLGSCVSVALWSRRHGVGGLCHGLLPARRHARAQDLPDGRYLADAVAWLEAQTERHGIPWCDLRASVFGGAGGRDAAIGAANVAWVQGWLQRRRVPTDQMDVGGRVLRRLTMDLETGLVSVAHGGPWTLMEQRR